MAPYAGLAQEGDCKKVVEVGIVTAEGCFEERQKPGETKKYATAEEHMLNGLVVTPQKNTEVVYSRPPTTATRASGPCGWTRGLPTPGSRAVW